MSDPVEEPARRRRASKDPTGRFPAESEGELPWTAFADGAGRRADRDQRASGTGAGAPAGWDADSPPTVQLNVGEITSRRARRLAEQAAAEAAAQLVNRGVDPTRRSAPPTAPTSSPQARETPRPAESAPTPAPARDWTEDTMPLPRLGRHATPPPSPTVPAAAPGPTDRTVPPPSARAPLAPPTSPGPRRRARAQARPIADAPSTTRPPSGHPAGVPFTPDVLPNSGSIPRVVPGRDFEAAPRHEARGVLSRVTRRQGRLLTLVAALLVVASVTGVVLVKVLTGGADDAPTAGQEVRAPQQTMLIDVEQPGRGLSTAAVIGVGRDGLGSVLVPGSLLLEVPGLGRSALSAAPGRGPSAAADALADALDVRIDGTWSLTTTGLSSLVDALGGIFVDVDSQVVFGTTIVPAGEGQRLAGVQAVAVAIGKGDTEAEEARLARFQQVLRGLLRALPETAAELQPLLEPRVGASSTTVTTARLADVLLQSKRAIADGQESSSVVPLAPVNVAGQSQYSLDDALVAGVVAAQLPGALRPNAGNATAHVRLQNGVGIPGLTDAARKRLLPAGVKVDATGNAPAFGHDRTQVLVRSGDVADQELGRRLAAALGLPNAQIAVDELGTTTSDALIVLGQDFADDVADRGVMGGASPSAASGDAGGTG